MIANILQYISTFFKNSLSVLLKFFSDLLGGLFNGLITVLKFLFKPIFALIAIILYFIYKIGELLVTLVLVLVSLGKLLYSFVMGIFNTIVSLAWTSTTPPAPASWGNAIIQLFETLEPYQLNKLAYVVSFFIWITTAFTVVKILSKSGGDD